MNDYGIFWGSDVMRGSGDTKTAIVENMLWKGDTVFLIGKEKAGKSIFSLQLACALTTGEDFLDTFKIPNPQHVLYVQAEGKRYETQHRLDNMMKGIDCDLDRFTHVFLPGIGLDTNHGITTLQKMLEINKRKPNVIFIDPLYMAMEGNMIDATASRKWIANVRGLCGEYDATLIVVHHAHRSIRNKQTGETINEGDDAIFGSFVWKAFPDHILVLHMKVKGQSYMLTCNTQRSANIPERIDFTLYHPSPLLFSTQTQDVSNLSLNVQNYLKDKKSATPSEISKQFEIHPKSVSRVLRPLLKIGVVKRSENKPIIYSINEGTPEKVTETR